MPTDVDREVVPELEPREGRLEVAAGVRIWYRVQGEGPVLAFQNGVGVTITFWEAMAERFARRGYTTLLWDYRGHGRSDEPARPADVNLRTCVDDLARLLDHLRLDEASLLGHSMGSQLGFEFYRAHRDRVAALVPTLGTYKDAISSFYDMPRLAPRVVSAAHFVATSFPALTRRLTGLAAWRPALSELVMRRLQIVHPTLSPKEWVPGYLRHMARLDPRVFMSLALAIRDHDASELLPELRVPVLVVAAERDFFCPPKMAREMAALIPEAELMVIPGGSHAAIIEQPELFELRVARFLEERVHPHRRGGHPLH